MTLVGGPLYGGGPPASALTPARLERCHVELLGRLERLPRGLARVLADRAAEHPLADEPSERKVARGRGRAARREVEREREPLDEGRVGGAAGLLLEPVRDERAEDPHLAHAGAERHDERGSRARDEHPGNPREEA